MLKRFTDMYTRDLQPQEEELERGRTQVQDRHQCIVIEVQYLGEK